MKACILTGGGDAPGLDAAIRGFVHRAAQLGIEVWGSRDGFEGLIESADKLVRLELVAVRGILHRGGSILGCSSIKSNPFAMPGKAGTRETHDRSADVITRIREHAFDALVLVGGDGTMLHARRFAERGIPCIGVPKTIDNDLSATDQTFGFDTAVGTATWAIDTLHSTAEAHERVMILEVMGRTTGWIALFSGIAGGADVILLPEIPYDLDRICNKLRGRRFNIVVVAEGARPRDGELTYIESEARPGQLRRLGGAGEALKQALETRLESEVRVTVLGHLQRGGSPSAFDRMLGSRAGVHAAELVKERKFGRLVTLRCGKIGSTPFSEMDPAPKRVDPRSELVATARALDIELGG